MEPSEISAAEVAVAAGPLRDTIDFFVHRLGFQVASISPADAPETASLAGHGVRLRLDPCLTDGGVLRLGTVPDDAARTLPAPVVAPNGTRIEWFDADPPLVVPPEDQRLVVTPAPHRDASAVGRAGMLYRDLIPERHGGRFIASHISIPDGGPVPDYVHFHHIRFQMIFCRAGWVKVAYEDQGEPLVMHAGDCVLQPPLIRHRVLEASPGLEVVEIACPARHQTYADLELTLPTGRLLPARDFAGQRFVHHVAAGAPWGPARWGGFERRDLELAAATDGLAQVAAVRAVGATETPWSTHDDDFVFWFVLGGTATFETDDDGAHAVEPSASVTVPAGLRHRFTDASHDLELLEVIVPR